MDELGRLGGRSGDRSGDEISSDGRGSGHAVMGRAAGRRRARRDRRLRPSGAAERRVPARPGWRSAPGLLRPRRRALEGAYCRRPVICAATPTAFAPSTCLIAVPVWHTFDAAQEQVVVSADCAAAPGQRRDRVARPRNTYRQGTLVADRRRPLRRSGDVEGLPVYSRHQLIAMSTLPDLWSVPYRGRRSSPSLPAWRPAPTWLPSSLAVLADS